MNHLSVEHLFKTYKSRTVVNNVSFHINSGEIVGLLGPNGAGKTTSFYMVVGLIKAEKGCISLHGQEITQTAIHDRAKKGLGYLPQEASVFRHLSVEDNIMAVLQHRSELNNTDRKEKLESLLTEFNINHIRKSMGISLSGGERRRVEIARTLSLDPEFILLDEPFAGVDPISVIDIQEIISQLANSGIGILITDHNVRETLSICQRGYILNEGSIIAEGSPDILLKNQKVIDVYLGENFSM